MSNVRHLGFGSTANFRNFYKEVEKRAYRPKPWYLPSYLMRFEVVRNLLKTPLPVISFTGTEKLHGENMAVCYTADELWVQGRNNIRTIENDQNGMAQFVVSTSRIWDLIIRDLAHIYEVDLKTNTIVIDMEWAGGNIQKGNAACSGTDKAVYIFDYFRVVNNNTGETSYKSTMGLKGYQNDSIYILSAFGRYDVVLDFKDPQDCELKLKNLAEAIEAKSPIAKHFNKPDNVGEGAYLTSLLPDGTLLRLKTKGEKHGGKPKQRKPQAKLTTEESKEIEEFAQAVTPVWRITQAITETSSTEAKHVGQVLKWVLEDIVKEEEPLIVELSVDYKVTHSTIVKIVKEYYFDSIKGF